MHAAGRLIEISRNLRESPCKSDREIPDKTDSQLDHELKEWPSCQVEKNIEIENLRKYFDFISILLCLLAKMRQSVDQYLRSVK